MPIYNKLKHIVFVLDPMNFDARACRGFSRACYGARPPGGVVPARWGGVSRLSKFQTKKTCPKKSKNKKGHNGLVVADTTRHGVKVARPALTRLESVRI